MWGVLHFFLEEKKKRILYYELKLKHLHYFSSAHPQGYFDSISLQSKIGFLSLSFTLLCIAQSHCEAADLDEV